MIILDFSSRKAVNNSGNNGKWIKSNNELIVEIKFEVKSSCFNINILEGYCLENFIAIWTSSWRRSHNSLGFPQSDLSHHLACNGAHLDLRTAFGFRNRMINNISAKFGDVRRSLIWETGRRTNLTNLMTIHLFDWDLDSLYENLLRQT